MVESDRRADIDASYARTDDGSPPTSTAGSAFRPVPWLVGALAGLPFAIMAFRVMLDRSDPVYSGDAGLLELAVRSAAHGRRLLGPYSRFGFFHPGPSMFYLFAPFEWITRGARWALPLGVEVVNVLIAAGAVAVAHDSLRKRRSRADTDNGSAGNGYPSAAIGGVSAAVVLVAYSLFVDVGLLQVLWNPLQVFLPSVLLLVAVVFVDRWGWAPAVALASATYVVQSDLSTLPVATAVVVCGLAWFVRPYLPRSAKASPREDPGLTSPRIAGRRVRHLGPIILAALTAIAWLPPLIQQVTGRPGNLGQLWDFFRSPSDASIRWGEAAGFVGRQLSVFPDRIQAVGSMTPTSVHGRLGEAEFAAFVALAIGLVVVGRLRRSIVVFRCGVVSIVGAAFAVYSVESIRGPVYWYLTAWMSALAVPLLLGWLLLGAEVLRRRAEPILVLLAVSLAVAAVVAAASTPLGESRDFPNEPGYRLNVLNAWKLAAPAVAPYRERSVVLGGDASLDPTIAGVALRMAQAGIDVRVPAAEIPPFGPEEAAPSGETPLVLVTVGDPPTGYRILGRTTSAVSGIPSATVSVRIEPRTR